MSTGSRPPFTVRAAGESMSLVRERPECILVTLFVCLAVLAGCDSQPPTYKIYPTRSIYDRLVNPSPTCDRDDPKTWWRRRLMDEMDMLALYEWNPSVAQLRNTFDTAAQECAWNKREQKEDLIGQAKAAFLRGYKLGGDRDAPDNPCRTAFTQASNVTNAAGKKRRCIRRTSRPNRSVKNPNDPHRNCVRCCVRKMCDLIDMEHPALLVEACHLKSPAPASCRQLPPMISMGVPVAVSLTIWNAPPTAKEAKSEAKTLIVANNLITPSDTCVATNVDGKTLAVLLEKSRNDKGKSDETQAESAMVSSLADFESEQHVTLSVSTALNSASPLDRIEYVSTYLYLQPFPFPPNGGVVLERDFWQKFLALNGARDPMVQEDTTFTDMLRALNDLRARVVDTETTVKLRSLDWGALKRTASDSLSTELSATTAGGPSFSEIGPGVGYSTKVETVTDTKLQQELDQRSTYVDPFGKFLRITQRGMQTVNLAGRFVENVTLSIPAAEDKIPVLVRDQSSEKTRCRYRVRWVSQPLYSRVDAITLSVVVARRTTALAKSSRDSFRLQDPTDAAFIAGVTRPYRITLWKHERDMYDVTTSGILDTADFGNQSLYFAPSGEERAFPLTIAGFTPDQEQELFRAIRNAVNADPYSVFALPQDTPAQRESPDANDAIRIGFRELNGNKLIGFKQK